MYEGNEDWKNIFHVTRINAPAYSQKKTFTWENHEDGSSKLVHLIYNQIIIQCYNAVKKKGGLSYTTAGKYIC